MKNPTLVTEARTGHYQKPSDNIGQVQIDLVSARHF